MPGEPDSVLAQACRRVSIPELAARLGMPTLKVGLQKSPFREDKRGASFSISDGGRRFKDHARPELAGNAYTFCKLARPDFSNREAAEFVIRAAGLDPDADMPTKAERTRFKAARRSTLYAARRRELETVETLETLPAWPAPVRDRFMEGWEFLRDSAEQQETIAAARGWPVEVVRGLLERGLIAAPWLPWVEAGRRNAKRGTAFRVDQPGPFSANGRQGLNLRPVGYHQTFTVEDRRQWVFVPYVPSRTRNAFQETLAEIGRKVHALPFVLGDLQTAPAGVAITEGQWDCATLYFAAGGLGGPEDRTGLVVFGMRGSQGIGPFLSAYFSWLRFNRPPILLLGDSDAAGRAWVDPPRASLTALPPVSFAARLEALGCRVVSRFIDAGPGKDFNGYWRARRPDRAAVVDWLDGLGIPVST